MNNSYCNVNTTGTQRVIVDWGNIRGSLTSQIDLWNFLGTKANISSLAAVAFSGDYLDLKNKPVIGQITLQQVTDNGSTTTDSITAGGLIVNGTGSFTGLVSGIPGVNPNDFATISQLNNFSLSLSTTGTTGVATFSNGILNIPNYTYTLPPATNFSLGGVIVGANISLSPSGGTIFLNQTNIINALGFTPYNSTNPNGYISSNQQIVLSGAVTGTGTTSIVTTIQPGILPTPGGSNTDIQFNNSGVFGGNSALTWNGRLFYVSGNTEISSLSSTGTTMVVASSTGLLSTQPIPQGYVFTGTTSQYTTGAGTYLTFPTNLSSFINGPGYITGVTFVQVVNALGYLPLDPSGNSSQYFAGNGSLVTFPTIYSPGGTNTDIQFNNGGVFGGSANFTWNGSLLFVSGNTQIGSLSSSGTTMVVASSTGLLSTQSVPISTTPGGSNTNIQYNNNGVFAGSSNLEWINTNKYLLITGSTGINISLPLSPFHLENDGLGASSSGTTGVYIRNGAAATASATVQISPTLILEGQGWKSSATAASQQAAIAIQAVPLGGTTAPSVSLGISQIINGVSTSFLTLNASTLSWGIAAVVNINNISGTHIAMQSSNKTFFPQTQVAVTTGSLYVGMTPASSTLTSRLFISPPASATSQINFASGTTDSSAVQGDLWFTGTNLFFVRGGSIAETVFTGVSGATAPSSNALSLPGTVYGTTAQLLGTPTSWASVVINGVTYKIPLYI